MLIFAFFIILFFILFILLLFMVKSVEKLNLIFLSLFELMYKLLISTIGTFFKANFFCTDEFQRN